MKYLPGQSGNPSGKPKGTLSKKTQLSKLLEPYAEELINKAVELAKQGEPNALRLCLERLIPRAKDEAVCFEFTGGDLSQVKTLLDFGTQIINAVANGELTLEQGQKMSSLIETHRKTIEIVDLENRVNEIEKRLNNR